MFAVEVAFVISFALKVRRLAVEVAEEYPERDACAAENHKLCFHCMELLFIENASACVERRCEKNVSVAPGKCQRLGESPQRHDGDPEEYAQRAEDVLLLQFLSQHGDSQKHEENILRADEEFRIDGSGHPESRECKERCNNAVAESHKKDWQHLLAFELRDSPKQREQSERENREEHRECLRDEEHGKR